MPIDCESQITQVTVYARGALVTRRLALPPSLPPGEVELRARDITPLCEAGSLRARLLGGDRGVVSVRSALRVPPSAPVVGPSVAEVRALAARMERLQAEHSRLAARRKRLLEQSLDPVLKPGSPLERLEARMDDALACLRGLDGLVAELDARLLVLGEALRRLGEQREAAALRDAQAASAARTGAGHPRREIIVRLGAGAGGGEGAQLEVSYVVREARFWPLYTLRLSEGGRRAELLLEALVTQLSGEDWRGVRLGLSTADLLFDARLPELPSLRFGRAQAPKRRAYRPPPDGLELMFAGYDRAFGAAAQKKRAPALPPMPQALLAQGAPAPVDEEITGQHFFESEGEAAKLDSLEADDELRRSVAASPKGGMLRKRAAPPPMEALAAPAMSMSMPMAPPMSQAPAPARSRGGGGGFLGAMADGFGGGPGGGGGALREEAPAPEPEEPAEPDSAWLDFDALQLGGPDGPRRGRLQRGGGAAEARLQQQAQGALEAIVPPVAGTRDPRDSRGRFDHRYDADGRCDVPSDGLCHRVALGAAAAAATLRFRAVPREAPEVYREVELKNPLPGPLLAGPVDVYVEGSLLLSTVIEPIDRGGAFSVGMGVEERLRIARNARAEEESAGLMGGSTQVTHTVSIEVSSSLGRDVTVEVLDRIPVSDDKSVEIRRVYARPEGEPYKQTDRGAPIRGGYSFRLPVPAGKKAQLEFQYRITLPAKSELVGGNRRE